MVIILSLLPKKKIHKNKKNKNKIKIGYFGLISDDPKGYRDLNILFNSINNNSLINKNFNFYFYGNNQIKNKNIKNFKKFIFCKNLDYFDALKEMKKMDYLLIIHTDYLTVKEVITWKFYEYLSTGIPIISITNGDAEVNKIINQHNLGLTINYKKKNLSKELLRVFKNERYNQKFKYINKYSRDYQNQKLINILKY